MERKVYVSYSLTEEEFHHDYNLVVDETSRGKEYFLVRKGNEWSDHYMGTEALRIVDDGDEVTFHPKLSKSIGYLQLTELYILLGFIHKTELKIDIDIQEIIVENTISL